MPKLIFRSNYFKNEPAVHRSNYIKYLGTREGVEMNPDTMPRYLLSTKANTLREDAHTHAVEGFANASMRGAGTPQAEVPFYEDQDMHGKKENYIDYISGRPGVALNEGEQHGLFSYPGMKINLEQVMDEVANHKGTVWINVISLKREDAQRVGYENIDTWRNMLWRHVNDIAANYSIEPDNLRWYAAFHNEGHHPHVHLVVYSANEHEGFLRKNGIKNLKSAFTNDIFGDELKMIYSEKSKQRDAVKEQARESLLLSLSKLKQSNPQSEELERMIRELGVKLKNIKGKKVYGYLHKNIKREIDRIVDELEKIPEVKECYEKWMDYQRVINGYYHDDGNQNSPESWTTDVPQSWTDNISQSRAESIPQSWNSTIPLSRNKEFKSIKNMIIREALRQSGHSFSESIFEKSEGGHSGSKSGCSVSESERSHSKNGHLHSKSGHSASTSKEQLAPDCNAFDTSKSAGHLAKQLEGIFNKLIGDAKGNNQSVSDSKAKQAEKEKKVALGQKEDDSENSENMKYMSM